MKLLLTAFQYGPASMFVFSLEKKHDYKNTAIICIYGLIPILIIIGYAKDLESDFYEL